MTHVRTHTTRSARATRPRSTLRSHNTSPEPELDDHTLSLRVPHPNSDRVSDLSLVLAGLGDDIKAGHAPTMLAAKLANSIVASIQEPLAKNAEPAPANILAAMRFAEAIYDVEGDVYQTVQVPAEITLRPMEIECDDPGAQKEWMQFWHQYKDDGTPVVDLDVIHEEVFYTREMMANCFPLELWDDTGNLRGLKFIEPTSMWVGRHFLTTPYGLRTTVPIKTESDVSDAFGFEDYDQYTKSLLYNCFVVNLNVQAEPLHHIPIATDVLTPIFGPKRLYMRYALPQVIRAARHIMDRQMLSELRRGTMEGFMNQLWIFTIGEKGWEATPAKIRAAKRQINSTFQDRTGALVVDHALKVEVVTPKPLDETLGEAAYAQLSQLIFRDLGFSTFLISGELPGEHGRGGGQQVDLDVQLALQRWQKHTENFIQWAEIVSRRYAHRCKDAALLKKHLPKFIPGAIGIKQTQDIKDRIMPLLTAGRLSDQTALGAAGYSYGIELENKKKERSNEDLFMPRPVFNQTASPFGGEPRETASPYPGKGNAPKPNLPARPKLNAASQVEFEDAIDAAYGEMLNGDSTPQDFTNWLGSQLQQRMVLSFQDGFSGWGGLHEPDYAALTASAQGLDFQLAQLASFSAELQKMESLDRLKARRRALLYAGVAPLAYQLGRQQAFKSQGATHWQRVLHPELSKSGPCLECQADAARMHPIAEPFFEYHPNGVCTPQSVSFHFGTNGTAHVAETPPWGIPLAGPLQRPYAAHF